MIEILVIIIVIFGLIKSAADIYILFCDLKEHFRKQRGEREKKKACVGFGICVLISAVVLIGDFLEKRQEGNDGELVKLDTGVWQLCKELALFCLLAVVIGVVLFLIINFLYFNLRKSSEEKGNDILPVDDGDFPKKGAANKNFQTRNRRRKKQRRRSYR